jgi:hypothetical protein
MRQIEVINLETIIDVTAETSNVEILVQDYDAELVERFALEAQEAAIDAEESADIATAQASIATAQATIATTQAGIATTKAGIATTQAGIATTKANEASASAASALASEQAADADRIAAQAAASTATTQAGIATTQAGIATTKAGEASASAASALASETDAETAASTATTQAGIATTQAGIATTQAGIATTQAGNALTSANNAAASAAAAAQVGTSTLLTGFSTGANSTILATDTILQGFNKTQGQINARVSGTIAATQVAFGTATNTVGGDGGLIWNNTVKRLELLGTDSSTIRLRGNTNGSALLITQVNSNTTAVAIGNSTALIGSGTSNLLFSNTILDFYVNGSTRWSILANGNLQSNGAQTIQTSTGNLTLATAAGNGNIVLTPNGTGNVGVNFATPNAKLESRATALIASAVDGNAGIRLSNTQTAAILMLGQGTAGVSLIQAARTSDNTAQLLSLQTYGGNVFIGSTPTDAGFRLDVNGTARVQGGVTVTTGGAQITGALQVSTGGAIIVGNTSIRSGQEGLRLGANSDSQTLTDNTNKRGRISVPQYNSTTGLPIGIISGASNVSSNSVQIGGIQGGYTLAADSIEFFVGATYNATSSNQIARFFSTGNLLIQNGGTFTDNGFRLDVNGTARVQGATTITGVTRIGDSSYNDGTLSALVVGINGAAASRVTVANNGNYQDVQFVATAISSGNINTWSFGQRRDTFFGNTIGSFQIAGAYTNNSGTGSPVGGGYRVPLICNPNGDVIIAGASANAVNGNVIIGSTTSIASAKLSIDSTTQGFLPPRMTTTQRDAIASPATGLMIYNSTDNLVQAYNGTSWINL